MKKIILPCVVAALILGSAVTAPKKAPKAVKTRAPAETAAATPCTEVQKGTEVTGAANIQVEKWVSGLEVPWGMGLLPNGDMLVSERPGRVRLIRGGSLVAQPVTTVEVGERGEGGLLGLAVHPQFATKPYFYVYYTAPGGTWNSGANRIARYRLSSDHATATFDKIIVPDFPAGTFHNGGRLRFGPDGMLYVGTGDARKPENAQKMDTYAGKILRVTAEGEIPSDNPFPGSAIYITGVRNVQGFDWLEDGSMIISDHGPTGEFRGTDHDEISIAKAGANLGWPTIFSCERKEGMVTPLWTWANASPPGGSIIYRGNAIPEWKGTFLTAILGFGYENARRLSQFNFKISGARVTETSERVYFYGKPPVGYGRLRDIIEAPDGSVFISTSNCDSRGECPAEKDLILKITAKR